MKIETDAKHGRLFNEHVDAHAPTKVNVLRSPSTEYVQLEVGDKHVHWISTGKGVVQVRVTHKLARRLAKVLFAETTPPKEGGSMYSCTWKAEETPKPEEASSMCARTNNQLSPCPDGECLVHAMDRDLKPCRDLPPDYWTAPREVRDEAEDDETTDNTVAVFYGNTMVGAAVKLHSGRWVFQSEDGTGALHGACAGKTWSTPRYVQAFVAGWLDAIA